MKISGHKTDAVFRRYNVVDEEDLLTAMKRAQDAASVQSKNLMASSERSVRVTRRKTVRKRLTA
jgi:hypothetical protein